MLNCPFCQSDNPPGHKFCQNCGEPLKAEAAQPEGAQAKTHIPLRVTLLSAYPAGEGSDKLTLRSGSYIDTNQRYQVVTVLNEQMALVQDMTPEQRSPLQSALQAQLSTFTGWPERSALEQLQAIPELPTSLYPYYLMVGSAPTVYDAWHHDTHHGTTSVVVTRKEVPELSSLLQSFATAADALNYVYWLYQITDLWMSLEPLPEWRSSLLLADHLGVDSEQSVRVRRFVNPSDPPPEFPELKFFLRSLLAQPNRVTTTPHPQIRKIILTVSSATTLQQLRSELSEIGEFLLSTTSAVTPTPVHTSKPSAHSASTPIMVDNTVPTDTVPTDTVPTNTVPTDTVPTNTVPTDSLSPNHSEHREEPLDSTSEPIEVSEDALIDGLLPEEIAMLGDSADFSEPDLSESTMVLPMKLVDIEEAGRTHVGRQRDHNEDCFFIRSSAQKHADNNGQTTQAHSLYVLCDGMGGHDGGEVASRLAAETLSRYFTEHWPHPLPGQPISPLPSEETITTAVRLANQAIFEVNEKEGRAGHERMGTTLVMALVQGAEAVVAHVGDSRLYQYARRGGLRQITIDHEVGQREMQRGVPQQIAYARPDAYQLTQALGPRGDEDLTPSVSYLSFSEDTLLLLCSDGLSDNNLIEDNLSTHIEPILRGKIDMSTGTDDLITLANEVNGHDNISAIAIRLRISPDMGGMSNPLTLNRGLTIMQ